MPFTIRPQNIAKAEIEWIRKPRQVTRGFMPPAAVRITPLH